MALKSGRTVMDVVRESNLEAIKSMEERSLAAKQPKQYPTPFFLTYDTIPLRVKRLLGCDNCEWKVVGMCQYGCKPGTGNKGSVDYGICRERLDYLSTYLPPDSADVSFEEWREFYTKCQAESQMNLEYAKLKRYEQIINKCEESLLTGNGILADSVRSREELEELRTGYNELRERWNRLNRDQQDLDNRRISRKTTKNISIGIKNIS